MRRKSKRKELRLKRKGNTYLWEELINGLWEPDGEIETAGGMSPAVFFFGIFTCSIQMIYLTVRIAEAAILFERIKICDFCCSEFIKGTDQKIDRNGRTIHTHILRSFDRTSCIPGNRDFYHIVKYTDNYLHSSHPFS